MRYKKLSKFLTNKKKHKPYIIELKKRYLIKNKVYLLDYKVWMNNYYSIIVINYNKYIFYTNDDIGEA